MIESINQLLFLGHLAIFASITLASCAAGVFFYRCISNRLAGFIYRLGR